jgi:Ras-related protein Rab-5C
MGGCSSKKPENNLKPNKNINLKKETETYVKEENKPLEAKIVLLGDQNVGKSSIAQRFCKNLFTGQYVVTIGGAYLQQKLVLSNGAVIKFHIWDTGGQERFRSMANLYYQDAAAAILTYDVTNKKSFESLSYWVDELNSKVNQDKLVLCLAGNKCDCETNEKKVSNQEAKEFAEAHNMVFFETSAKNDLGIRDLFQTLGKRIYDKKNSKDGS